MNALPLSNALRPFKKPTRRLCGAFALALMAACTLHAQNADPADPNNAALEAAAMLLSNAVAQLPDLIATNEVGSNDWSQSDQQINDGSFDTNLLASPGSGAPYGPPESRRAWMLRQRAGRPGTNDGGPPGGAIRTSNNIASGYRPAKPDYSAFRIIPDRNVFDPNRVPHRPGMQPRPAKTVESFALVGVMSYEKGAFAFFDGTSSDYRKALKEADTIAGFKVTKIEDSAVKLLAGTNQVDLRVGMQLRREDAGDWVPSTQAEIYTSSSTGTASTASTQPAAGAAGSGNDILERLRKKREQE